MWPDGEPSTARVRSVLGLRGTLLGVTIAAAFLVVGALAVLEVELVDSRLERLAPTLSAEEAARLRAMVRTVLGFGAAAAVLVAGTLGVLLGRLLVVPLERLTAHARALQRGEPARRMAWRRSDEIGQLAEALDALATELRGRIDSLRAERERLSAVLDAMAEGVVVTDGSGRIERTNPALRELLGGEPRGRLLFEVVREPSLRETFRRARKGEPVRCEGVSLRGSEGRERIVDVEGAPLGDRGVVLVLHDVTARRRAERARRDFVAAASHELRTPLTVVGGYAETLLDAVDDPELRRRFAQRILEHTRRMQRLTRDLLALSRAEAGRDHVPLEAVDLSESLRIAWERVAETAEQKAVRLEASFPSAPPDVLGTEATVQTILANLLENAVRHGPKGRPVRVEVREESAGCLRCEVADEGPGIASEHHDRIFERFYRVDRGRSRREGGTGIGLALVKHLCARIGARVSVQSRPGEGARFVIRFRRVVSPGSEESSREGVDPPSTDAEGGLRT